MKPPVEVVASVAVPEGRYILITGKLSAAGEAEKARRVKAGENSVAVYAELLMREGKAILG